MINFANMSNQEYSKFNRELEASLADFCKKHNIAVKAGNGRHSADGKNITIKIDFSVIGMNGEVERREKKDFLMYCTRFGLQPTDLNKKFRYEGEDVEIIGLAMKRRRYPILCKKQSGKETLFNEETVKMLLKNYPVA